MEDEQGRRYLKGSTHVGVMVYTAIAALALLNLDAGEDELSFTLMGAADLWAQVYPNLSVEAKELWADHYEELMTFAAETEAE